MQWGEWTLETVSGGRFRIDGGTMFGVVPKVLWSRRFPADDQNRIAQGTNCVLIRTGARNVLIDTGYGSKFTEKQRAIYEAEPGDPLAASLSALGVTVDDIDVVVLSHLHFDHAGGATRRTEAGELIPTFPRAEYVVQRVEWELATADLPELRGAYPPDNLWPLERAGQLRLIDGEIEILPGLSGVPTPGHTSGHQSILIEQGGETAIYVGDLCPTARHLPALWCMAYDVDLLEVRRRKPLILGEAADGDWLVLLDHDPEHAAIRLKRDDEREFRIVESYETL
jgi:glyoxylase-like metal-dependent hydrolase (beta-lactamase superfamily II)